MVRFPFCAIIQFLKRGEAAACLPRLLLYCRLGSDFKYSTRSDFSCAVSPRLKQLS